MPAFWKPVALVAVVVVVAVAIVALREKPVQEEYLPPAGYVQFRGTTFILLENTADNLLIENVTVYGPFPDNFENLIVHSFFMLTESSLENRGHLSYVDGYLENTLTFAAPDFTIENIVEIGFRSVTSVDNLYPGDVLGVAWIYWAPENTVLYDTENNEIFIRYAYQPDKPISIHTSYALYLEESYENAGPQNHGTTWWAWATTTEIDNSGWYLLDLEV